MAQPMSEKKTINELEGRGDEDSRSCAHRMKKRSKKFKRLKTRVQVELVGTKYFLPEYPFNPLKVKVFGVRTKIKTFVVHGREIIWTGAKQSRPPNKIWVEYERLSESKR